MYKIVLQKDKMDGHMDVAKHKGLPKYAIEVHNFLLETEKFCRYYLLINTHCLIKECHE